MRGHSSVAPRPLSHLHPDEQLRLPPQGHPDLPVLHHLPLRPLHELLPREARQVWQDKAQLTHPATRRLGPLHVLVYSSIVYLSTSASYRAPVHRFLRAGF